MMPTPDILSLLDRLKQALLLLQNDAKDGKVSEASMEAVDAVVNEELATDERVYTFIERLGDVMEEVETDTQHVPADFGQRCQALIDDVDEKVSELHANHHD